MDLWGSLGNNYLHSSMIEDGGKLQRRKEKTKAI